MKKYLLPQNGNFYKGNMHCHSTLSDGSFTPEELKKLYKEHGYSVLAVTDHEGLFYHPELDDPDFLTIAGYELEYNEINGGDFADWRVTHICAYKKDPSEIFQPGFDKNYDHPGFRWLHTDMREKIIPKGEPFSKEFSPENINFIIARLKAEGFLVTYNHPKWSGEGYKAYSAYKGFDFMEIYNHGCFVAGYDEHNGSVYDDILRAGARVGCVATDDNHRQNDMFGGFVMFKAPSLTYSNIIGAFERGEFYASTGLLLDEIYVEDGVFTVRTKTPADKIRFTTDRRHAALLQSDRGDLTEGSFALRRGDGYVRAEILKNDGTAAYTRAYFADEVFG